MIKIKSNITIKIKSTVENNRGYSLMEMMIVVAIISILATMAQPNIMSMMLRAREATLKKNLFVLRDVIDQFYGDHGKYPDSLDELVEKKYIREVPIDPMTASKSTWIIIPPETGEEGTVYDVHSGSYKVALNGEPYNDW